uniref:Thymus, brain and testes associated n=1 Tax=Spermophilus dauricus TaxID=99837 RepID=A0A8C9URT3_SPEDA
MATEVRSLDEKPLSPKAKPNLEKKPRHWPQSLGDSGPQKESVVPGIVDLELTREKMRSRKAMPSGTYRFGRLSHHSFFSRHHPHPHHVTHIPDFTGRPVCIVRNKLSVVPSISVPIGDPQSNRNPQLSYGGYLGHTLLLGGSHLSPRAASLGWMSEKERAISLRSAESIRRTLNPWRCERKSSIRGRQKPLAGLGTAFRPVIRLQILELLCQILQTDSLSAVQYWLLYATPTEKDLALALLQRAVSQLLPQPSASLPAERLLNQPQQIQEAPQEKLHSPSRWARPSTFSPAALSPCPPDYMGKAQVLRVYS